jgi:MFS family permease
MCILEIGLFVLGIIVLVKREFKVSKNKELRGGAAITVGLIMLAVFPLAFATGFLIGFLKVLNGEDPTQVQDLQSWAWVIDAALILGAVFLVVVIGITQSKPIRQGEPPIEYDDEGFQEPKPPAEESGNPWQAGDQDNPPPGP